MSSNEIEIMENVQTINFTTEETDIIKNITDSYTSLYRQAKAIQEEITKSENHLKDLVVEMDQLKESEVSFFQNLASKYDLDPLTIANAAAVHVLHQKK
jgi:hypothetical protein